MLLALFSWVLMSQFELCPGPFIGFCSCRLPSGLQISNVTQIVCTWLIHLLPHATNITCPYRLCKDNQLMTTVASQSCRCLGYQELVCLPLHLQGSAADAAAALIERAYEQVQLLSASFARCIMVVEGSPAFVARVWAHAEALYTAAERAGVALKLTTSSGPAKSEACHAQTLPCAVP